MSEQCQACYLYRIMSHHHVLEVVQPSCSQPRVVEPKSYHSEVGYSVHLTSTAICIQAEEQTFFFCLFTLEMVHLLIQTVCLPLET